MDHTLINLDELTKQAYELKPLPPSVGRLSALLAKSDPDFKEIVQIISFDQALTMCVLKAANSAAYGTRKVISKVNEAVLRLGVGTVYSLVVGMNVSHQLKAGLPQYGLSEGELWRHSVAAALVPEVLPKFVSKAIHPESFVAALLHDVGKLVLARFLKDDVLAIMKEAKESGGLTDLQVEKDVLQVHHGELGALIAQHWELPERIVDGIYYHHDPDASPHEISRTIHLANLVAHAVGTGNGSVDQARKDGPGIMEAVGGDPERFSDLCDEVAEKLEGVCQRYG